METNTDNIMKDNTIDQNLLEHVKNNDIALVKQALKSGADVNYKNAESLTVATEQNNIKMVDLLIEHGADATKRYSPLNYAALINRKLSIVQKLIGAGANPNGYYASASTLCHSCYVIDKERDGYALVDDNQFEIAEYLLKAGASPNGKRGDDPGCPIMLPIIANDFRMVRLLLDYSAKLTVISVYIAANWCALKGRYEMLELLLENGFKPNPKKAKGKLLASPLNYAIAEGHEKIIKLLLKYKIDVNYVPNYFPLNAFLQHFIYKYHPLTVAIMHKRDEILKLLLENGSDPNGHAKSDKSLPSPIFTVLNERFTIEESIRYIKILIDSGADVNIKESNTDLTPVGWALKNRVNELVTFLQAKGGS